MKKIKTIIAAVMAATMVLTMTGCDEEVPNTNGGGGSAPTAANNSNPTGTGDNATTSVDRKDMEDEDVTNAAKALADQLSYPDLKVTKRIKWMAWWDMDETAGEAELFKEVYGIPETGDDPASAGRIFEFTLVDYAARYDRLATSIASDESPDLFPFEITDFPYGILMNRYNPVDDIVDFSDEKWAATRDLNEQFMLNGKHYTAFWTYTISDLMWYKKSNIEAIGADDPQELFNQGKWDWDAFLALARAWQDSGSSDSPRFITDGWTVDENLVTSTGVPIIGTDGSKLVSNLRSAEVERAEALLETLQKENLRYPRHELNEWQYNPAAWANDQILLFCDGTWRYEDDLQGFKRKYKWAADEIRVVPYPKDPQADKHYVQIKVDVPMWVKGSTNAAGVQAWYDCCVTASKDKALHDASNAKSIKNPKQGWTQELLDFLDNLYGYNGESPVTPIVDFKNGLGPSAYGQGYMEDPVKAIVTPVYLTGTLTINNETVSVTFPYLRDTFEGVILKAMDDINARI